MSLLVSVPFGISFRIIFSESTVFSLEETFDRINSLTISSSRHPPYPVPPADSRWLLCWRTVQKIKLTKSGWRCLGNALATVVGELSTRYVGGTPRLPRRPEEVPAHNKMLGRFDPPTFPLLLFIDACFPRYFVWVGSVGNKWKTSLWNVRASLCGAKEILIRPWPAVLIVARSFCKLLWYLWQLRTNIVI